MPHTFLDWLGGIPRHINCDHVSIADLIRREGREPGGVLKESPEDYLRRIPATATLYDLVKHGVISVNLESPARRVRAGH
jgi:hypothetical protein